MNKASGNIKGYNVKSSNSLYGIEIESSEISVADCIIENNPLAGIGVRADSIVNFENVESINNQKDGFHIDSSEVTIKNSSISDNKRYAIITFDSVINLISVTMENNEAGNILNRDDSSTINMSDAILYR